MNVFRRLSNWWHSEPATAVRHAAEEAAKEQAVKAAEELVFRSVYDVVSRGSAQDVARKVAMIVGEIRHLQLTGEGAAAQGQLAKLLFELEGAIGQ